MSYSNGVIRDTGANDGVSAHDVQQVLNTTDNQWKDLCTESNINKWAKYKPETPVTGLVSYGIVPITAEQRALNGYSLETLVSSGIGDVSTLVDRIQAGTAVDSFIYKQPTGGMQSAYRISDFDGYWHDASCPIRAPYNPTDALGVTQEGTLQLYYYTNIEGSTYGLGLKDLRVQYNSTQLSDYYFGILIYNNTFYAAATQSTPMGTGHQEGLDVTLTGVPQVSASYQMVPFFSTQPFTSADDSSVKTIFPMLWAAQEIHTAAESQNIIIGTWGFVWDNDMQHIRFKYSVTNNTSGTHTFNTQTFGASSSYVEVGYQGQALHDSWPIAINVSVPANSEVSNIVDIAPNILSAQADLIRNGDSRVHVEAAAFNGKYTYDDIIQTWIHED